MNFIQTMADAGVRRFIFHYEVTKEFDDKRFDVSCKEVIAAIDSSQMQPVIAINPSTEVERIFSLFPLLQTVLVMTVVPGKGGQKFIAQMMDKVKAIKKECPSMFVEVDGGVGPANITLCGQSGVTSAVCGTALLRAENKSSFIYSLRSQLAGE